MTIQLNPVILYTVAFVFLAILAFLAYLGYRHAKSGEDYMLAGRKVPPYFMAISYGSVLISTASIVGFGGMGAKVGMGMFWIVTINIGLGVLVSYIVFGPRIQALGLKYGAQTMAELLGKRFNSRFIQGFAGIVTFLFMPLYTGAVLVGVSRLLETILGVNFGLALIIYAFIIAIYVIGGGLKGMIYVDVVLGVLKFCGLAALFCIILFKSGGLSAVANLAKLPVPPDLAKDGVVSFTQMPAGGSPLWWLLVSSLLIGIGLGLLAQPQLAVRFMTLKSKLDIKRAIGFGAIFVLVANGGAILVGAFSNVVSSFQNNGQIAYVMAGRNADSVIPYAVRSFTPEWFVYILLFTLLSAAISASTAQIHTMAASFGYDLLHKAFKLKGGLNLVKGASVLSLIIVVIVAYNLPHSIIAIATSIFFGIAAATFLPTMISAMFWQRATRQGVISSMIVGFLTIAFFYIFVHAREAEGLGICKFVFGKGCLAENSWIKLMDPTFVAVPLSALTMIFVSLFTRKTDEKDL